MKLTPQKAVRTPTRPDASRHRPADAAYIAALVIASGLSQAAAAARIGVGRRTLVDWLAGKPYPYAAQFALERLPPGI